MGHVQDDCIFDLLGATMLHVLGDFIWSEFYNMYGVIGYVRVVVSGPSFV